MQIQGLLQQPLQKALHGADRGQGEEGDQGSGHHKKGRCSCCKRAHLQAFHKESDGRHAAEDCERQERRKNCA